LASPPAAAQAGAGDALSALEALANAAAGRKAGARAPAAPAPRAGGGQGGPADALAAMAQAARDADAAPRPAPGAPDAAPEASRPPAAPARQGEAVASPADPLVGTTLNGFKVLGRIGSGGFGVVYRAFDTNLERSVAIKMLPPRIAKAGKGILDRFLREARSAAKLSHPNIVTIHQICPYKDTFYIVMELVDGGALHEHLGRERRFEPAEATRIIRAAAEGLGHAHRRGIIHRDVKPGNIMLTNDGQVKVSDFGLARDVLQGRDIVGPGHSLGTPRYMAPEQALGEEPTAASDLYSLAATYYALLTGRAPFDAATDREMMKRHVTDELPDPRQFVPDLPPAAFRFLQKAMAKEAEDRFLTAEEFIEALDRLDFSPVDASRPVSPQALSAQIGPIAPEDRGAHLTETLDRVVRRASRERTPTPLARPGAAIVAAGQPKKSRALVWVLVAIGALVVIGGAIAAAYILAHRESAGPTAPPGPGAPAPGQPGILPPGPGPMPPGPGPGPMPPPGPGPMPPGPGPMPPGPPPKPPDAAHPLEDAARAALEEVRQFEADKNVPRYEVIQRYQENVIDIYSKTKAAEEARKAVERLKAEAEGKK